MLRNRIITASILAPLIIAAVWWLPADGFAALWGFFILLAAWEWGGLCALEAKGRVLFLAGLLSLMVLARVFALYWAPGELPIWFYGTAVVWWALWGLAFRRFPEKLVPYPYPWAARLGAGLFILFSGWALMVWLRLNFSSFQVLYVLLLIWLADIAAYFTGKNWGFTKLVPAISPGKTVEGVYGALFAAVGFAIVVGFVADLETMSKVDFVFLSVMTVAFSICGDLVESLAKRVRGVKDSGGLLPGHGGVLDRIDSLLSGVAVFYAGSLLIPIFLQIGPAQAPELVLGEENMPSLETMPSDHHFDGPMEVPGESAEEAAPAESAAPAPAAPVKKPVAPLKPKSTQKTNPRVN